MIVMGVDPGLITTGYGLLEKKGQKIFLVEGGFIKTLSSTDLSIRLKEIFSGISDVLMEFKPEIVVVEKLYSHYKHPTTAILMGHARGAIYLAASLLDIPVVSYGATEIKKAITGSGRASKSQIQNMISRELCLKELPKPNDVSDALAIALAHINKRRNNVIQIER